MNKIDFDSSTPIPVKLVKPKKQVKPREPRVPKVKEVKEPVAQNSDRDAIISQIKDLKKEIKDKKSVLLQKYEEFGLCKLKDELTEMIKLKNTLIEQLF